jgi:hypothetical protein
VRVLFFIFQICEKNGHVYMHLARSLYQELMMLGILSFVILLLNAEGYAFDLKTKYSML